jgi:hypothetical protein
MATDSMRAVFLAEMLPSGKAETSREKPSG